LAGRNVRTTPGEWALETKVKTVWLCIFEPSSGIAFKSMRNDGEKAQYFQKLLLILAVVSFVIGIPVTLLRVQISPAWTVALPVGVVCLGLFLLSYIWHDEMLKFDDDARLRIESAMRREAPISTTTKKSPLKSRRRIWWVLPRLERRIAHATRQKNPCELPAREIT
jgi:hypothetical protein